MHDAAAGGAAAASAMLAGGASGGSGAALVAAGTGATGAGSDNPLAAVLLLLGEPLDLLQYGPERTCLVFEQGNFNAQVREWQKGQAGGWVVA